MTVGGARPDLDEPDPDSPTELSKPSLFAVVKRAAKEFRHDNLTDLAAGLTYYALLSIVPGLIVLLSLLGLLGPDTTGQVMDQVQQLAPGSGAEFVQTLITQAQANKTGAGIGAIVALTIALWSASGCGGIHARIQRHLRHRRRAPDLEDGTDSARSHHRRSDLHRDQRRDRRGQRTDRATDRRLHRRRQHHGADLADRQMAGAADHRVGIACDLVLGQSQRQTRRYEVGQPRWGDRSDHLAGGFRLVPWSMSRISPRTTKHTGRWPAS